MRETCLDLHGIVTHHQTVPQQSALDGTHRADDTKVVQRLEPGARDQENAAVEPLGTIGLDEAAELLGYRA